MNAGTIAKQMAVLFLMMALGYGAFKRRMVSREGARSLSSLIVNILNPCLVLSGVLNKEVAYGAGMVAENLGLVVLLFGLLMIFSFVFIRITRPHPDVSNTYRLMTVFPNLGFMGIPLVSSVYGEPAVIFVAFYIVGFNLLIYSYGILLSTGGSVKGSGFSVRKLFNPGMASCLVAIVIFAFHIRVPAAAGTFFGYMGNAAVAMSMMAVGMMVAQSDLKRAFTDRHLLMFTVFSLVLIPAACIPLLRLLPIDPVSYGIFILLIAMPVGSTVTLVEMEYGGSDGTVSASGIALTSLLSMATIPLICLLA